MTALLSRFAQVHSAFWRYDPWYRIAWFAGPQAVSFAVVSLLIAGPQTTAPPSAPWAKPAATVPSNDFATCGKGAMVTADVRLSACTRAIQNGGLAASELALAFFTRGTAQEGLGQLDLALLDYGQAITHVPGNLGALINRGRILSRRGNMSGALADFDRAIKANPQSSIPLVNRADLLGQIGRLDEALADIAKAKQIDPASSSVQKTEAFIRGQVERRGRGGPEATPAAGAPSAGTMATSPAPQTPGFQANTTNSSAASLKPEELDALRARIDKTYMQKDYTAAIADLTRIIDSGLATGKDYEVRGTAYRLIGQNDEALRDLTQAIAMPNHTWYSRIYRGGILAERNKLDDALADFDAGLKSYKDPSPRLYFERGKVQFLRKNLDAAIVDFAKYQDAVPDDIEGTFWHARAELEYQINYSRACRSGAEVNRMYCANADRFNPAISDFTKILDQNPRNADAQFLLGFAYHNAGRNDEALDAYTKAIAISSNLPGAYQNRGAIYVGKGDLDRAMKDFNDAARLNPRSPDPLIGRAKVFAQRGNRDAAIAEYRRALDLDKGNVAAQSGLKELGAEP